MSTNWDEETEAKYVVSKADGTAIDDAVVIRLKDPFAATALHSYANTILSTIELIPNLDPDDYQRMIEIADYFAQKAMESQAIKNKRLPD